MADNIIIRSFRNLFGGVGKEEAPKPPRERQLLSPILPVDPSKIAMGWKTYPYNPSWLVTRKGLALFDLMKRDEQVKAALKFKKDAVLGSGWEVASPGDKDDDWEVTEFVRDSMKQVYGGFHTVLRDVLTALDYGYSVGEKVYRELDKGQFKGKITMGRVNPLKPHYIDFHCDDYGGLLGVAQQVSNTAMQKESTLHPAKVLTYSHQKEFGNYYGTSDLEASYRAWWLKENAYRWLAVTMERYGMPPIFAMYDSNAYLPSQIDELKKVVKSIQNGTMGVIPRPSQEALEMWSQDLGTTSIDMFLKAIDTLDQHISRGILVPSMIGMSSDQGKSGSLARSQSHFDSFMLVVEMEQANIASFINDQYIPQLVDLNWPDIESYPEFKFLEFDDEKKLELMSTWSTLVSGRVVGRIEDDEAHIRKILGFPENDDIQIEDLPDTPQPQIDPETGKPIPGTGGPSFGGKPKFPPGAAKGDGKKPPFGKPKAKPKDGEKVSKFDYEPDQPRWPAGTVLGGQWRDEDTVIDSNGVVHTDNVQDAAKALGLGMQVDLKQEVRVSYFLDELSNICEECVYGPDAQKDRLYDLCKVTVRGTNLFCTESKGIPRVLMPQLGGNPIPGSKADALPRDPVYGGVDLSEQFQNYLRDNGIKVSHLQERVDLLKATQNELNGRKVSNIAHAMLEGKVPEAEIFVSKDNYIVDGHHRWAAKIGVAAHKNELHDLKMPVMKVDMDIVRLLAEANDFAADWGIPQAAVKAHAHDGCSHCGSPGYGYRYFVHPDGSVEMQGDLHDERTFDFDGSKITDWVKDAEGHKGVWRTIRGRRIFIREGEDLGDAIKRSKKDEELDPDHPVAHDGVPYALTHAIESHSIAAGGVKDRRGAADLAEFLGEKRKDQMLSLIDNLPKDKRPMILLHRGDEKKGIPTVWLLGWSADEGTDIHDHVKSQVGLRVLRGEVTERVYAVADKQDARMSSRKAGSAGIDAHQHEREARAGTTLALNAPYIHEVYGTAKAGSKKDVTLHAYYPPLKQMTYFKYKDGKLIYDGEWDEQKPDTAKVVRKTQHGWVFQYVLEPAIGDPVPESSLTDEMREYARTSGGTWVYGPKAEKLCVGPPRVAENHLPGAHDQQKHAGPDYRLPPGWKIKSIYNRDEKQWYLQLQDDLKSGVGDKVPVTREQAQAPTLDMLPKEAFQFFSKGV